MLVHICNFFLEFFSHFFHKRTMQHFVQNTSKWGQRTSINSFTTSPGLWILILRDPDSPDFLKLQIRILSRSTRIRNSDQLGSCLRRKNLYQSVRNPWTKKLPLTEIFCLFFGTVHNYSSTTSNVVYEYVQISNLLRLYSITGKI